jgi:hypothetical protein
VFAIDEHQIPLHVWQDPNKAGGWTEWTNLGSGHSATSLVVGQNQAGYLEVFDLNGDGTVFHIWQDPAGGGGWSEWTPLE